MLSAAGYNPFQVPDISQIYPVANGSWQNDGPYRATQDRTVRNNSLNTSIRNLILIMAGQSNRESVNPSANTLTNPTVIDNFNIFDGAVYAYADPPLGCSYAYQASGAGPGNLIARVADKFISGGQFDRVICVPVALGGTDVALWATGPAKDLLPMVMRRLASRGFVAQTNVTVAIEWGQGEAEITLGTTQAAYQTAINTIVTNVTNAGFSGRFFVAQQTWGGGVTNATIRAAQAAVVNGTTIFASGDIDTLNNSNRFDTTHLNDAGAAAAATLIYNAMHASGAPF